MSKTRKNRETRKRSPTRGWKAPPRSRLMKKCGKKCFLGTRKSFPICSSNCKVDKRGVYSAYVRARQFRTKGSKYRTVSKKAKDLIHLLKKVDPKA